MDEDAVSSVLLLLLLSVYNRHDDLMFLCTDLVHYYNAVQCVSIYG